MAPPPRPAATAALANALVAPPRQQPPPPVLPFPPAQLADLPRPGRVALRPGEAPPPRPPSATVVRRALDGQPVPIAGKARRVPITDQSALAHASTSSQNEQVRGRSAAMVAQIPSDKLKKVLGAPKPGSTSTAAAARSIVAARSTTAAAASTWARREDPTNAFANAGPSMVAAKKKRPSDVDAGGDLKRARGVAGPVARRDDGQAGSSVGHLGGAARPGPLRHERKSTAQRALSLIPVKGSVASVGGSRSSAWAAKHEPQPSGSGAVKPPSKVGAGLDNGKGKARELGEKPVEPSMSARKRGARARDGAPPVGIKPSAWAYSARTAPPTTTQPAALPARAGDTRMAPPQPAPVRSLAELPLFKRKTLSLAEMRAAADVRRAARAPELAPSLDVERLAEGLAQHAPVRPPSSTALYERNARPLADTKALVDARRRAQPAEPAPDLDLEQLAHEHAQHAPPPPRRPSQLQKDHRRGDKKVVTALKRRRSDFKPLGGTLLTSRNTWHDELDDAAVGGSGTGTAARTGALEQPLRPHRAPDRPVLPTWLPFRVDEPPSPDVGALGEEGAAPDTEQIGSAAGALGAVLLGPAPTSSEHGGVPANNMAGRASGVQLEPRAAPRQGASDARVHDSPHAKVGRADALFAKFDALRASLATPPAGDETPVDPSSPSAAASRSPEPAFARKDVPVLLRHSRPHASLSSSPRSDIEQALVPNANLADLVPNTDLAAVGHDDEYSGASLAGLGSSDAAPAAAADSSSSSSSSITDSERNSVASPSRHGSSREVLAADRGWRQLAGEGDMDGVQGSLEGDLGTLSEAWSDGHDHQEHSSSPILQERLARPATSSAAASPSSSTPSAAATELGTLDEERDWPKLSSEEEGDVRGGASPDLARGLGLAAQGRSPSPSPQGQPGLRDSAAGGSSRHSVGSLDPSAGEMGDTNLGGGTGADAVGLNLDLERMAHVGDVDMNQEFGGGFDDEARQGSSSGGEEEQLSVGESIRREGREREGDEAMLELEADKKARQGEGSGGQADGAADRATPGESSPLQRPSSAIRRGKKVQRRRVLPPRRARAFHVAEPVATDTDTDLSSESASSSCEESDLYLGRPSRRKRRATKKVSIRYLTEERKMYEEVRDAGGRVPTGRM
ncbi:uncharacterized protein RHOBADRAFT_52464 [Rhodotorula graminis WP1]|uniref:Uncharacterized protein n=1 Tax=Rhodotorula graminis (strain WP1) TaxID=578459 RepID=A0A194S6V6_RHOGW|nr:uncharacterized protein RHOBADRAFT_52464 [Rhodotorula graminis WP1]KPV76458.1 hypothetical protein RHOBADRAFT_52464 [Rhodotorula graminis WP1]